MVIPSLLQGNPGGKSSFRQYSTKSLGRLREALQTVDMDEVWLHEKERRRTASRPILTRTRR